MKKGHFNSMKKGHFYSMKKGHFQSRKRAHLPRIQKVGGGLCPQCPPRFRGPCLRRYMDYFFQNTQKRSPVTLVHRVFDHAHLRTFIMSTTYWMRLIRRSPGSYGFFIQIPIVFRAKKVTCLVLTTEPN